MHERYWYRKYKDYVYGGCYYRSTWKNKEYLRSKDKAKNYMMYEAYIIAYVKIQKMSNLQPNCCLKI